MDQDQRSERLLAISDWERLYFQQSSSAATTSEPWVLDTKKRLPERYEKRLIDLLDRFVFYTQTLILNSNTQHDTEQRMLTTARVFDDRVQEIADLKHLRYEQNRFLLEQSTAKQRLISFGQGGLTGLGGPMLLAADLPLMLAINLRTVQLSAMSFGYDLRHPAEMMIALKAFHTATLPRKLQRAAWIELQHEKERLATSFPVFYDGKEEVITAEWLQQPLRQIGKLALITMLRKKMVQGIPVAGIFLGAMSNYQFSRQVSDISAHYYEKRYLEDMVD
ncbi:EcsC family protein [Geomicrobium sp. JCM 19039]|uniref:EcsC family protein n=1 Tax=Geomicrobium sp. JCM 19039 TaxID=1460636 RepID=UPI00045F1D09|nr:EcsC family protein [Geomicrobium sp. JCM 19039]GAK12931.1 EcsC protein [Geomicrobium sp. JCM 19039]